MDRIVNVLSLMIILLAGVAAIIGICSNQVMGVDAIFESVRGETIELYGKGVYAYDSVSVAAQGKAQDVITAFIALPALLIALITKKTKRGSFMLIGILSYIIYTYTSYVF